MIEIIKISSTCSDPGLSNILVAVKNLLTVIQIIVPIILIIMGSIHLINIARDPENKKGIPKVRNAFIAAAIVFFIPIIINALMVALGDGTNVSSCWNNAKKRSNNSTYIKPNEENKDGSKMIADPSDYENGEVKEGGQGGTSSGGLDVAGFKSKLNSMSTPTKSDIAKVASSLGISDDYLKIIIGTTYREGYANDPYLYYGWASAMINRKVSIEDMQKWDPNHSGDANFYSWKNILDGYEKASGDVLKSVYLALTNRNTKIIECNGMYSQTPSTYNLIYKSSVYDISIYETK